ncbi:MAG TPA: hypothetical protein VMG09_18035 [Bacteroidota bacterium]|nr:hypothetical protein [Bacteroidota bacterium]
MKKKILIGFVVSFVLLEALSYLVNGVLLRSGWESVGQLLRPDMNSLMWVYYVITLVEAFFFTFIFSKGFEGKGIMEGVRYGLYIGIWLSIGMAYGTYAMIAIPYSMALQWFIYGILTYVIAGIGLALVFGKKEVQKA